MLTFTGISSELYATFQKWLGRFKGGLSMATIGASAVFAAASGSSIANTATIGQMAAKEMMKNKYDYSLAGGSIVAGGTLGILIPAKFFPNRLRHADRRVNRKSALSCDYSRGIACTAFHSYYLYCCFI